MKAAASAILAAMLTSCASTSMSSVAAPEAKGSPGRYSRIVIYVAIADLDVRREAENQFVRDNPAVTAQYDSLGQRLTTQLAHEFIASYTLLFPGRQYSKEQVDSVLHANRIDGYLVVTNTENGIRTTTTPSSSSTDCTATDFGYQVNASCTTQQHPGMTYNKPWAKFTANLYDITSGQSVWYATSTTGGNAFASWSTVVHSMADKTVERLQQDGVIR
jgi:hypothetical protein